MRGILVVGGGPAGLMAALGAAEAGARVTLLEKNDDLGRKLLLTGNGRCNLTNDCGLDALVANLPGNGPFLYHALSRFGPEELRAYLHRLGLPTVVEPGGRVFPAAGRSAAVLAALRRGLERAGVTVRTGTAAVALTLRDGRVTGAATSRGAVEGQAVILATGGASYPQTGSTGDGYRLAAAAGHRIVPPRPALVPLIAAEDWVASLAGLSLPGAGARLADGGRSIGADRGDMLFTHWGVSGPLVLGLSRAAVGCLSAGRRPVLRLDLRPDLSAEDLEARLRRAWESRRLAVNALAGLVPARLAGVLLSLAGSRPDTPAAVLPRETRARIRSMLKDLPLTIAAARPLAEAHVTAGGVCVKEVDPCTMASRLAPGLYFAGELLDVDGRSGGFNLQAAFSTGRLAGMAAARAAI